MVGGLGGERFNVGCDFLALCREVLGAGRAEPMLLGVREILAGGSQRITYTYVIGEGDAQQHLEVVVSALAAANGPGALLLQYDVSERERQAAAKAALAEHLRRVLELLPEGYWDWNIGTDEVYYSERWLQSQGFGVGELEPHVRAWVGLLPRIIGMEIDITERKHAKARIDAGPGRFERGMEDDDELH